MSEMTSSFDPNLFLEAQTSEVNTSLPPLPVENPASPDGMYMGIVEKVEPKTGTVGKGPRAGKPWISMQVSIKIDVPQQLQDSLSYPPTYMITDGVFLDLTENNTIDNAPGRNRRQKQYREALNLNNPGDVWSWSKAVGQPLKFKIDHEMYNGNVMTRVGVIAKP